MQTIGGSSKGDAAIGLEHEQVGNECLCSVIRCDRVFAEAVDHNAVHDGDEKQRGNESGIYPGEPLQEERAKSIGRLL